MYKLWRQTNFIFYKIRPITLMPPRLLVQDVSFFIPDKLDVSSASMSVTPELLPIFSGKFQTHRFSLNSPEVKIQIADDPDAAEKKGDAKTSSLIETLKTAIQGFEGIGKNPILKIVNGRITLLEKETTRITVQDISLTYKKIRRYWTFPLRVNLHSMAGWMEP